MSQNRVENIASQTVLYVYIYSLWEVILSQRLLVVVVVHNLLFIASTNLSMDITPLQPPTSKLRYFILSFRQLIFGLFRMPLAVTLHVLIIRYDDGMENATVLKHLNNFPSMQLRL